MRLAMMTLDDFRAAVSQLGNADFLHVLCGPLLFWAPLVGVIVLLAGCWPGRSVVMQRVGMLLLVAAGLAVIPVVVWRPAAVPRTVMEVGLWKEQVQRVQQHQWIFHALASLAGVALLLGGRGRFGQLLRWLLVVGGLGASAAGLHLADREARIHHAEVIPRTGDPRW
jgi:hypothetical protein